MIKLIGAVLIAGGGAVWGMNGVMRLRNRVRSLSAVVSSLDIIRSEICDRMTPMPELLELMSKQSAYPANLMFKNASDHLCELGKCSFAAIWRYSILNTPEMLFTPQEALVMSELGLSLGRYDAAEQRGALVYTQKRMEQYLKKAEAERERDSKLQAFLGIAAGIFAVIMLL